MKAIIGGEANFAYAHVSAGRRKAAPSGFTCVVSLLEQRYQICCFEVSQPACRRADERLTDGQTGSSHSSEVAQCPMDGKIFSLSRSSDLRAFIAGVLRAQGYEIWEAKDGLEALPVHQDSQTLFRLIITAIAMPHMDGPTIVQCLRWSGPDLLAL
jgi:hypothetical protein